MKGELMGCAYFDELAGQRTTLLGQRGTARCRAVTVAAVLVMLVMGALVQLEWSLRRNGALNNRASTLARFGAAALEYMHAYGVPPKCVDDLVRVELVRRSNPGQVWFYDATGSVVGGWIDEFVADVAFSFPDALDGLVLDDGQVKVASTGEQVVVVDMPGKELRSGALRAINATCAVRWWELMERAGGTK